MRPIPRTLGPMIKEDLEKKIVLLSGPRQVGKTFLSRSLYPDTSTYLNFDLSEDRKILAEKSWSRKSELLILDEIHKMKTWKRWLKGIYDVEGVCPRLLGSGSARMDIFRKGGDSLAGRHHLHRLHPFSVAELKNELPAEEALSLIMRLGGFPEPLLSQSEQDSKRWRKSHLDRILREDLLDLERVRELKLLEMLVDLLAERVASTVSYKSLADELQISPHTVKKWIQILENLYVIFVVTPYSKNIARAILKEPKIYFFDTGRVANNEAARLENTIACALLKRNHFLEDTTGAQMALHYTKDKEQREVDFLTIRDKEVEWLIEVKASNDAFVPHLQDRSEKLKPKRTIHLVKNLKRELQRGNIEVLKAANWLATLES